MEKAKLILITVSLVFSFSAYSGGLKSKDMGNQSLGSGNGSAISPEQLEALQQLSARNPDAASGQGSAQPQISQEQMQQMMKVLEEYKGQLQERNNALQDLLKEDH